MQQDDFIPLEEAVESRPLTVSPDVSLVEVIKLMSRHWSNSCLLSDRDRVTTFVHNIHNSCVLAIVNSQIQGIFTERDLVSLISTRRNLQGITLAEVMNRDVITLDYKESQNIFAAVNLLRQHQIRHLPIIDENHHLLGLISQDSLHQALQSVELLKFRKVREVMSRAIHALPNISVLEVAQLMADYKVSCIPIVERYEFLRPIGIITETDIVQFQLLELNLAQIEAREVMSTPLFLAKPEDSLWKVQQRMERHLLGHLVVTGEQGELLGVVTENSLLQKIEPRDLQVVFEILQRHNNYLLSQLEQQASELQERRQKEQLVAEIALRIRKDVTPASKAGACIVRQSLDLESILNTTVTEVRELIQADRVLIYRFEPDFSGIVTNEAVSNAQWSILHRVIKDSCFEQAWIEPYQQNQIHANADIYRSNLSPCYIEFLESFQVKANIAIPILLREENSTADRLWGLLVVHQCSSPRNWQESELELLQMLSTQVAIAIQQGELYQQAQIELDRRRQAEVERQESESRFRIMANTAPVMLWMSGVDKLRTFFNQPWLNFTGRTLEQELGNGWAEGVHPEDNRRCWDIYSSSFDARQEFTMEYRLRKANGEYGWILDKGIPHFSGSGEFIGYIGSCIDISDRITAEARLRERETQLSTALDAAMMGTWSWDIATDEVILSERSLSILGFNQNEFPGTLDAVLDRIHPDDIELINEQVKKAIDERKLYEIETRISVSKKKYRWLAARGHVLLDSDDRPTRMIGIIADITEKKQLEDKYLRQQRLESLGSLAGGVAHDLNNILTPILMSVQLLPVTLSSIDPRSRELIQMLENNVKRGSALVQQVLTFARGIEGERGIVQVKHLIADIRQIARETFPKSIEVRIDVSSDLWAVRGDATKIHQILLNLVINARDAMPHGGNIDISATNLSIDEEFVREHSQAKVGSYVAISIADTGVGIRAENIEHIFEPFFTTKEDDGGTGLGLATVINIVQSHGGFIDVVSEIGRGTQFNVFIPAVEVSETELQESLALPKGEGELILVADDEATIREITRASLETHNYRVITANDGIEAVAAYVQNQTEIALVLMNMIMPAMDGTTAIRTLHKINPDLKIIAISGRNFSSQTFSDRNLNISSFLAKPYSTESLLRTIRDVLRCG